MRTLSVACLNFLDTDNPEFRSLHTVIDNVYRNLRMSGVGSSSKGAETFKKEEELELWEKGILGTDNPVALI